MTLVVLGMQLLAMAVVLEHDSMSFEMVYERPVSLRFWMCSLFMRLSIVLSSLPVVLLGPIYPALPDWLLAVVTLTNWLRTDEFNFKLDAINQGFEREPDSPGARVFQANKDYIHQDDEYVSVNQMLYHPLVIAAILLEREAGFKKLPGLE